MKGPDVTPAEHKDDVQDIAAGPSADDAVPSFAAGVIGVYPDALRVRNGRFGVFAGKTVLLEMLEVRFIPPEQSSSHGLL